jgi:hypothetical protein
LLLQDVVRWARTWSAQFDYVDTLLALKQYDVAQATCVTIQLAADDDEDSVTFDYAVAIKARIATCVAQQTPVPLVAYGVIVTVHTHLALNEALAHSA